MGLSYCTSCRTTEGKVVENDDGDEICGECGDEGCIENIPEHDDLDMER